MVRSILLMPFWKMRCLDSCSRPWGGVEEGEAWLHVTVMVGGKLGGERGGSREKEKAGRD